MSNMIAQDNNMNIVNAYNVNYLDYFCEQTQQNKIDWTSLSQNSQTRRIGEGKMEKLFPLLTDQQEVFVISFTCILTIIFIIIFTI
jgi:hypothetical protein